MSQETPASTTEAQIKNKRRISPFWLLPFIALMIAGWLIWDSYQDRGNTVTIDFMSADGIVPGRTPVRYQGVEVGTVQDISLSDDLRKIEVKVSIKSDMKDALREETQFWLVTPKASLAGVSGLDALVGGNYIGMMPGKGKEQDHFVALDTQPKYRLDNGDLMIHLQAPDLGSLNSGSLVYFRKIPVGKVYDYAINPNKQGVVIDVLIERRFTDLVKKGSRFWNVSGVDANVSVSGAKVKLESLAALVNGAIAFDSPEESKPAEAEDTFGLYEDLAHSQRGVIIKLELPSGAGLTADSTPLMYQGLEVGQLTKLDLNPGGKVTGEMTVDPSVVTLLRENTRIELRNPKLSLSDANISRCGISNVALTHFDGRVFGAAVPEMFDAILLDAPCSGEGVVRKDPDALKNWSPESNQEIAATQRELIDSAFHALRPGGTLVYSTCTLNQEENEAVCLWLKETYPDAVEFLPLGDLFPGANKALTEEGFLHVFPQIYDCEGFFVARLRKTQAIPALPAPKYKVGNFPFSPVKDREAGQIRQAAASVGLNWDGNLRLWQRDKELWLFPVGIEALIGKVRFSRLGIKLAETHNKGYRWQHEAVIALATPDNVNAFELTPQEAEEWYRGRDVYPQAAPVADDVLVTFQHQPIGLAKRIGSRLKNSYPRELVRDGKLFTGNA